MRSSSRFNAAVIGVRCSVRLRRIRSATTGKNVSACSFPSRGPGEGEACNPCTAVASAEKPAVSFSSTAFSRSTSGVSNSASGTAAGGDAVLFTERGRGFSEEAEDLAAESFRDVGEMAFAMRFLSQSKSRVYSAVVTGCLGASSTAAIADWWRMLTTLRVCGFYWRAQATRPLERTKTLQPGAANYVR